MIDFDSILGRAAERAGGLAALLARCPEVKDAAQLAATPDDRYLSEMSRRIFRAGLKHSLVDAKWPAFEEVFAGFDPHRVRAMSDEAVEALLKDARLIRNGPKLRAVRDNAAALLALTDAQGAGFGAYLAGWPGSRIVELWDDLTGRFAQLGGNSAPMFLRAAGKDTFILTPSVGAALTHWGVVETAPKSKADRARVQAAFNAWAAATGRPLSALSVILALSVDS